MRILFLFLIIIFFSSCSSKNILKIETTNQIEINKSSDKTISIMYSNNTDKKIELYEKLKKELTEHGYKVVPNDFDRKYTIDISTIFANEIGKKSTAQEILSNTNLNITIGQVFGNVGVSGTIGSKIGSILGDSLDTKSYQIILDVTISEHQNNMIINENITQVIAERTIDEESIENIINMLENKIVEKLVNLFP
ncbi:complement resistance protein TraT [Arcobacter sp.]|uniref:complement resistance protein TraT n=1 Tax=Arcobacter sp. TaxID=1872629 RepID=UPI003D13DE71